MILDESWNPKSVFGRDMNLYANLHAEDKIGGAPATTFGIYVFRICLARFYIRAKQLCGLASLIIKFG